MPSRCKFRNLPSKLAGNNIMMPHLSMETIKNAKVTPRVFLPNKSMNSESKNKTEIVKLQEDPIIFKPNHLLFVVCLGLFPTKIISYKSHEIIDYN
jgi:hypothetical protein